ncbi:peptidase [Rhizobium sp. CRIBSB]|nr:peptidase [Rhizobium sp. CRIBSB]
MRRVNLLAAVGVLSLIAAAGPALAQESLRIGARVTGTLAEGDGTGPEDGYRYDDYRVTARAGQRLEFIMRSGDFDAYLEIFSEGDPETALASDDDGLGEDVNARLRFTPEADGVYLLRARNLGGLEGGAYTLSAAERPAARRAPRPTGIRIGQTLRGSISSRDAETENGEHYDAYVFRGVAGQRVALRLNASGFDPIVRIGRGVGEDFTELASNDDWGGELNSYLVYTLPEAGEYVIRASPLTSAGSGGYSLTLGEAPPPPPSTPVAIGDTVDGELSDSDGLNAEGQRADIYRFTGATGQRVRIELSSDAFDTYLRLTDADGGVLAEDDDGAGEGTNSRVTFTLTADGDYLVEARAFSEEGAGSYALALTEVPPVPPAQPLPFGEVVQGEIADADPRDENDRGHDDYAFSGVEGQRVQAIMRSGDFDTYLRVSSADGEFAELASDDDGLGEGTDSRLNFTLPATGDYVLRASPLGGDSDGLYSIELIDRGPEPAAGSILVGATARGRLLETDAASEDGSFFDGYRFTAKAGDTLIITMVSNDFDAFISVGSEKEDGAYEALANDDDGLSDTHARLEWEVPEDGTYVVRAGSFGQGETGDYALTLERKP